MWQQTQIESQMTNSGFSVVDFTPPKKFVSKWNLPKNGLEPIMDRRILRTNDDRETIISPIVCSRNDSKDFAVRIMSQHNGCNTKNAQEPPSSYQSFTHSQLLREEHEEVNGIKTVEEYLFLKNQLEPEKHGSFLKEFSMFEKKYQQMMVQLQQERARFQKEKQLKEQEDILA